MVVRTVRTFEECDAIKEIVIVTRQDLIVPIMSLCAGFRKVTAVVAGGRERSASVNAGLNALSSKVKLVAVHDGARPLITWQVIDRVVRAANSYGAAAPAVPVKDTVKEAENGVVVSTPDRSRLFAIQTPQVFEASLIKAALVRAQEENWSLTDDCALVERLGMKVSLTQGSYENIKITTPIDVALGEAILAWREEQ